MTPSQAERFVDLLARSKAVWMDSKLLNLVEGANSPNHAFKLVMEKTGKRKKALAARWYAVALREADNRPLVGAAVRFMRAFRCSETRLTPQRLITLLTYED